MIKASFFAKMMNQVLLAMFPDETRPTGWKSDDDFHCTVLLDTIPYAKVVVSGFQIALEYLPHSKVSAINMARIKIALENEVKKLGYTPTLE